MEYISNPIDIVKYGGPLYTWIIYGAKNGETYDNISRNDSTGRPYIGILDNQAIPENNATDEEINEKIKDFVWTRIQGEQGPEASIYTAIFNTKNFYKYYGNLENGAKGIYISPSVLEISIRDNLGNEIPGNILITFIRLDQPSRFDKTIINEKKSIVELSKFPSLLEGEWAVSVEIKVEQKIAIQDSLFIGYGSTETLAKFNVTASNIQSAVDNTEMVFDATGLTLTNGGFKIKSREAGKEKNLFYIQDKKLYMNGNIDAESGIFRGTVEANKGTFENILVTGAQIGNEKDSYIYIGYDLDYDDDNIKILKEQKPVIVSANYDQKQSNYGFRIDGREGKIFVNSMYLGNNIEVGDKIFFTDENNEQAYICNPARNNGNFIGAGIAGKGCKLSITANGNMILGEIGLYGDKEEISGKNWSITKDLANFKNANISGTLSTAIFEKKTTRLSGGATIFKNASKILKIIPMLLNSADGQPKNGSMVYIDSEALPDCKNGDLVSIKFQTSNQKEATQNKTNESGPGIVYREVQGQILGRYENPNRIWIDIDNLSFDGVDNNKNLISSEQAFIVYLGSFLPKNGETTTDLTIGDYYLKDWIIGINSESNLGPMNILGNSITFNRGKYVISESKTKVANISQNTPLSLNKTFVTEPTIILGQIPKEYLDNNLNDVNGLYADSVFLKGSLTTRYENPINQSAMNHYLYAGIDTLSKALFNKEFTNPSSKEVFNKDNSPIVLWAGSAGTNTGSIQNSPFQVTSNGTLYAQQGYFEGSILSKATIVASDIYAINLYPLPKKDNAQEGTGFLTIHGDDSGIRFLTETSTADNNPLQLIIKSQSIGFGDTKTSNIINKPFAQCVKAKDNWNVSLVADVMALKSQFAIGSTTSNFPIQIVAGGESSTLSFRKAIEDTKLEEYFTIKAQTSPLTQKDEMIFSFLQEKIFGIEERNNIYSLVCQNDFYLGDKVRFKNIKDAKGICTGFEVYM